MKDYIKVGDVVRVRENIFINREIIQEIKVGEKEEKVLHRTPNFEKIEFLDGTYTVDEKDDSINIDLWFPIEDLEKIEVESQD
ncbi:hypothetical protein ES703_58463 [subsurface metagenome]